MTNCSKPKSHRFKRVWSSSAAMCLLSLLLWTGCSNDTSSSGDAESMDAAVSTDGLVLPGLIDSAVNRDGGANQPLGYLESCSDNEDCQSGWCVASPMGYVCSRICFERNDCEDGWSCLVVSNTPPDITSICLPPTNRLCNLCTVDRDCPGGHCYELDGESVCGLDCGDEVECPENYTCTDLNGRQTCVPNTNSCSCNAESSGEIRFCERSNEFGSCVGREVCDPAQGWTGCTATEPLAEICNGLDDDCNGFNDDIFGLGELCEREADIAGERISCAGVLVCSLDSEQPVCTATDPMEETCNFIDDDCDGETDEGFENNGDICVTGTGLCQRIGVFECSPDGDMVQCSVEPASPNPELCDGLDNDCDENIDETFPDLNNICTVGEGACQAAGVWKCSDDLQSRVCSATAREATEERCDSIDNDCDDSIDEGFGNLLEPCSAGEGACKRQGFIFCSDDTLGTVCTAEPGLPTAEICNGLDDNCDGTIDEGFPGVNQPCFVGQGVCRMPGITVCSADGTSIACNAMAGSSTPESCNGLDDDCDGEIDEDFGALGRPCESDALGICKSRGVYECAPDGLSTICDAPVIEPNETELCNGLDDNCDGQIDENFPEIDTTCATGVGTCERRGRFVCNDDGDAAVCNAVAGQPAAEVCNGLDDNCDGTVDEGYEGVNQPCFVGDGVCRNAGITVCNQDGSDIECNATAGAPRAEICNGLDDDCNGTIDDGFEGVNQPCFAGLGSCRTAGLTACTADGSGVECNATPLPSEQEVCNGLDDDCDGVIDNGFVGLNQPCTLGQGVCRATGMTVCNADGQGTECNAEVGQGSDELCNGLDDNCDGRVDELFPELGSLCDSGGLGVCQSRGVFECAADGRSATCNAPVIEPAPAELCNGLDDNCNGSTDEGFEQLNTVCTVGAGACERAGIFVCSADGSGETCNATPGEPGVELCNRIDDNCNGEVDETFESLGAPCNTGLGLCRRSGVLNCDPDNPAGAPICDAEIVTPNAPGVDTCDYQDDDCDGEVDESFVDENGRYSQVANCGACGTNCTALWDPSPEAFGVVPTCADVAGTTQCSYTCIDGFLDADGVASNGCELSPDDAAIYVQTPSNGGNDDVGCGVVQAPCASITYALERAQLDNKPRVRVAEGSYRETINLVPGIEILGGHQRVNWERNPELFASVIFGADDAPTHKAAVKAVNINVPTRLDGFSINAEPVLFDGNSYGVYIVDSTSALVISNNRVLAANGGIGRDGGSGASGAPGPDGSDGLPSYIRNKPNNCNTASFNDGASGGVLSCNATSTSGGDGGDAVCPRYERQEGSGGIGGTIRGGAGGAGAFGVTVIESGTCSVSPGGIDAFPGSAGGSGVDGNGGNGANATLGNTGLHWSGNNGENGSDGLPGGGGGGGGAAAGVDITVANPDRVIIGASGGGGGAGGCQGSRGLGGNSGGGSFGIFIAFDAITPIASNDYPSLTNNVIWRGLGGRGGSGGKGGAGGEGGLGGLGGPKGDGTLGGYAFCSLTAGEGGTGGRGGHAGGGGGGQGGNSFDIFIVGSNNVDSNYLENNEFPVPNNEFTAGVGGEGGNSSNTATGEGDTGNDGLSGQLGQLP